MFCPECGNHAANKALRKLGIETKKTMVEVLPVTEFEETGAKEYKGFYQTSDVGNAALEIGKSYTVILDGQEYSGFLCKPVGTSNQRNYIGNSIVSGEENNVPFIVISVIATGVLIVCTKTVGTHTLAIYEETETIHPIDQKYLPGVVLDLTKFKCSYISGDSTVETTLNDLIAEKFEESLRNSGEVILVPVTDGCRELQAAVKNAHSIVVSTNILGVRVDCPCVLASIDGYLYQMSARYVTAPDLGNGIPTPIDATVIFILTDKEGMLVYAGAKPIA